MAFARRALTRACLLDHGKDRHPESVVAVLPARGALHAGHEPVPVRSMAKISGGAERGRLLPHRDLECSHGKQSAK